MCAAAALAAITELEQRQDSLYPQLEAAGSNLAAILRAEARAAGLPLVINQVGGAAYSFWSDSPVDAYPDTAHADGDGYRLFARALLDEGIHVIPRGLLYVSAEHTEAELEQTHEAVRKAAVGVAARVSGPISQSMPGPGGSDATAEV